MTEACRPHQAERPLEATTQPFSLCLLALLLMASSLAREAGAQGAPDSLGRPFHVTHYDARVEPNISDKTIKGIVVVDLIVTAENQTTIELDSGDLTIDAVNEGGRLVEFDVRDHRLTIRWPRPARVKEARQLEVEYHGAPRFGMQFALPNGTVVHEWRQDRPMPSYTFGFAAGRFMDVTENRKGHRLRYLGSEFSTAQLRRIFSDSVDMMRFFEDRAGVQYPDPIYTQALVANTVGQEMSGFSVMSEDYGRAVLGDPRAESLIAHELAHQWWGNSVTCRAWTHMWLNEGFATFMAAAFMEQRFGRDEYLRTVETWRSRYSQVRDAGHDRSLVFPNWNRPTTDDRTLVYQKGAYVLHLLRETLGEAMFWAGIRDYTRRYAGTSVTTLDFQHAMEQSTLKDLSEFFKTWVFLDASPK